MSLKNELPTLEKGSADFGGQLRALREVIVKLIDAVEGNPEAFAVADEKATEAAETPAEPAEPAEEPAVAKPASKPATRAAAK